MATYPADTPKAVVGLIGWWKADSLGLANGAAVPSWGDSSGVAGALVQATSAKQPLCMTNVIGGRPVVRFNGTSQFMEYVAGAAMNTNATMTVFLVGVHRGAGSTNSPRWVDLRKGTDANGFSSVASTTIYDPDPSITPYRNSAALAGQGVTVNTPEIGVVLFDGANEYARLNGGAAATHVSSGNFGFDHVVFAASSTSGGAYADFGKVDIAEVIIYNRALTSFESAKIDTYLRDKYAIPVADDIGDWPIARTAPLVLTGQPGVAADFLQPGVAPAPSGGAQSYSVSLTESLTTSDAVARTRSAPCSITDGGATADSLGGTNTFSSALTETVTGSDVLMRQAAPSRTLAETTVVSDTLARAVNRPRALTETLTVSDVLARLASYLRPLRYKRPTRVQSFASIVGGYPTTAYSVTTGTASLSGTLTSVPTAGNLLVMLLTYGQAGTQPGVPTPREAGWTAIAPAQHGSGVSAWAWYKVSDGTEQTHHLDWSVPTSDGLLDVVEFSGVSAVPDQVARATANNDLDLATASATSQPLELVVGVAAANTATYFTVTSDTGAGFVNITAYGEIYYGSQVGEMWMMYPDTQGRIGKAWPTSSQAAGLIFTFPAAVNEPALTTGDALAVSRSAPRSVGELLATTDVVVRGGAAVVRAVVESLVTVDASTTTGITYVAIAESVASADAVTRRVALVRLMAEGVVTNDGLSTTGVWFRTIAESVISADAMTTAGIRLRAIAESVITSDAVVSTDIAYVVISESVASADAVTRRAALVRLVAESVATVDAVARSRTVTRFIADAVRGVDSATWVGHEVRDLAESLSMVDEAAVVSRAVRSLVEVLLADDVLDSTFGATCSITEVTAVADALLAFAIFSQVTGQPIIIEMNAAGYIVAVGSSGMGAQGGSRGIVVDAEVEGAY